MRLYVEPMDATVVELDGDGRVQLSTGEWFTPTMQERRAILYAAGKELECLRELLEALEPSQPGLASEPATPRSGIPTKGPS